MKLNGSEAARSLSGGDIADPQGALEDLVADARKRGTVLPVSSILSTGTASKPFTLSGSAEVSASFLRERLAVRTELHLGNDAAKSQKDGAMNQQNRISPEDARLAADMLVQADLWRHQSHGVMRLSWYVGWLRAGVTDPTAYILGAICPAEGGKAAGLELP